MKKRVIMFLLVALTLAVVVGTVVAQRGGDVRGRGARGGGRGRGGYDYRRDRMDWGREGVPEWKNDPKFEKDVFTFVRIQYNSYGGGWRRGGGWRTDYPASDLNFSFRLQQLTALKVNPVAITLRLTDPDLFNYPFIYIVEPGNLYFSPQDVVALRRYLTNGGFLMVDDFWGEDEWLNFYTEIKKVFPDLEPEELPLSHPIFHCVYDLKKKPQIPSIGHAMSGYTSERGRESATPHYKGIFDDDDRMMVIICHNTDLGDGWEREGENEYYFREFSEKYAYPLGINIVTYAMTH